MVTLRSTVYLIKILFRYSVLNLERRLYTCTSRIFEDFDRAPVISTAAVANTFFSMYFHLAIVNFRGDEIIIVLPLRRLVYFHSKISYIFRWTSWINITGARYDTLECISYFKQNTGPREPTLLLV